MIEIALTNDDGIESPGLRALAEAVSELGNVTIIAPSKQQTSAGRSLRGDGNAHFHVMDYPVNGTTIQAYHCDCTPAMAVLHAFGVFYAARKPDLVISGINYGENLGSNLTISGTVCAAIQAAALGIRAMSISLQTRMEDHTLYTEQKWQPTMHFARFFARRLIESDLPADMDVLNINVPASATPETPWKLTRASRHPYFLNRIATPCLTSRLIDAKLCYGFDDEKLEPGSDIQAIRDGFVSVTPISIDLTSRLAFDDLNAILK